MKERVFKEKKEIYLGFCPIDGDFGIEVPRGYIWTLTKFEHRGNWVHFWGYPTKKRRAKRETVRI